MAELRCGPSGWAYKDWEGRVYPRPHPRSFHPIEFLADRFDTIEIAQTFTDMVRPELAKLWVSKVDHNSRFKFTARLNRLFTHERSLDSGEVKRFSEGLKPLTDQGRLGCVLMQFPYSFRYTEENKDFLIRLRRAFHHLPLVAELRHRTWASDEGIGTLIDYHVGYCNLDQPQTVRAAGPSSFLTWRIGYVKLHGRVAGAVHEDFGRPEDDVAMEAAGKDYLYTLGELSDWKARIDRVARFSEQTYVVFANHGLGRSVVNAMQMQGLVGAPAPERRVASVAMIPPPLVTRAATAA
ncbi:MAG: DUF72 domain-containing protein [Bryobacteraceae bacterium]